MALVWARDEHAVALIYRGWFVDYYDFTAKHGDPLCLFLCPSTDTNALKAYHTRIAGKLDRDTRTQVIQWWR
jgi:hypothetical protein